MTPRRSRPTFTGPMRGHAGVHGPERWDNVLGVEGSLAFRLTELAGRLGRPGRALGALAPATPGPGLVAREQRVAQVAGSPLYRRLEAVRGRLPRRASARPAGRAPAVRPPPAPEAPAVAAPAPPDAGLGAHASRAVDEALELLQAMPFEELQRRGWHFQPNHFYWPLNDVAFLEANRELWHDRGLPAGIDWDLDGQVSLLKEIAAFAPELSDVPEEPPADRSGFGWANSTFSGLDALAYYGLLRLREPRRVVEIGAGWSSHLLARAQARNERPLEVTLVEPFPDPEVFSGLPAHWTIHQAMLQHADPGVFERLEAGDVCFYDGTHVVRTAGDLNWFLFEVMPRLAPGVLVHFHDIFFPDDYHDAWILDEALSWNEQYLLQAFLMHNDAWSVRLGSHLLASLRPGDVAAAYGAAVDGGSLWLERR